MAISPFVPAWYDALWFVMFALQLILAVIALTIVWRERRSLDGFTTVVWTLVAIFVPAVFLVAWGISAFIGSRSRSHHEARQLTPRSQ